MKPTTETVKDGTSGLARCLRSVAPFVDRFVLAKLGLRTAMICQALGDAHFRGGRYAEARRAFAQIAALGEATPLSEAKLGACEVHLGLTREGIQRIEQAVAGAPAFCELYDILIAAALMGGDTLLAARTLGARVRLGQLSKVQYQLADAIEARLRELQRGLRPQLREMHCR